MPGEKLVLPIKLNLGGPLGSGRQWYPWVHLKDLTNAIFYLIKNTKAKGVFNLTAPKPIRQKDMANSIASMLRKLVIFPAPVFLLRLATGNLADELILASIKAVPERLLQINYSFRYPDFEKALKELI